VLSSTPAFVAPHPNLTPAVRLASAQRHSTQATPSLVAFGQRLALPPRAARVWQRVNHEAFQCFRQNLVPNALMVLALLALPLGRWALPHYAAGAVFVGACAVDTLRGVTIGLCPALNPQPHLQRLKQAVLSHLAKAQALFKR
jgi:hypothetical protein